MDWLVGWLIDLVACSRDLSMVLPTNCDFDCPKVASWAAQLFFLQQIEIFSYYIHSFLLPFPFPISLSIEPTEGAGHKVDLSTNPCQDLIFWCTY